MLSVDPVEAYGQMINILEVQKVYSLQSLELILTKIQAVLTKKYLGDKPDLLVYNHKL